jgi:hypothetical protein
MPSYEGFLPMAGVHGMLCAKFLSFKLWRIHVSLGVGVDHGAQSYCLWFMMEKLIIATILLMILTFWDF